MQKSKRLLSLLICVAMALSVMPALTAVAAENQLKIGDYVVLGSYYDEPILWRVVTYEKVSGYDDDGNPIIDSTQTSSTPQEGYLPLLITDKIIMFKAFDGSGTNTTGSHGTGYKNGVNRKSHGSNNWGDSNLRSWLNSDAAAGEVKWPCGNAPTNASMRYNENGYSNEAGFLTNFTEKEISVIQPVNQRSLWDPFEASPDERNITSYAAVHESTLDEIKDAYSTAPADNLVDKVFLIDIKQANNIYKNLSLLGADYLDADATARAKSHMPDYSLLYWLRTPGSFWMAEYESTPVRLITSSGNFAASYFAYDDNVGVRPSVFLNVENSDLTFGNGSYNDPYIAGAVRTESVSMDKTSLELVTGSNEQLTATVEPADATNKNVIWGTNNKSVAYVDPDGKVHALAPGKATITAITEDGNFTASCEVTVSGKVASIVPISDVFTVILGNKPILPTEISALSDTGKAVTADVNWDLSGIDSAGTISVTGNIAGSDTTPTITLDVLANDWQTDEALKMYSEQTPEAQSHFLGKVYKGKTNFEFDVTVNELFTDIGEDCDGVISLSNQSTVYGKEAIAIHLVNGNFRSRNGNGDGTAENNNFFVPAEGETYRFDIATDTLTHTWSGTMTTPDGQLITIADNYGYRTNQDTIDQILLNRNNNPHSEEYVDNIELKNLKISWPDKDKYTLKGISLDRTEASLYLGQTIQLNAKFDPVDAADTAVTWTTTDADVATVNENGLVTARKSGEATITATGRDGGFTSTCNITVQEANLTDVQIPSDRNITIIQGNAPIMPATIRATTEGSGVVVDVPVTWVIPDLSQPGEYTIAGTIPGYEQEIDYKVTVLEAIEAHKNVYKMYGTQYNTYQSHSLQNTYSGSLSFEFDLKINFDNGCDGVISLSNQQSVYGKEAIAIHFTGGHFRSRNGNGNGGADSNDFYKPVAGETYRFNITTDTLAHKWSGTMTTPTGEVITIANDYGYRTNQDSLSYLMLNRNGFDYEYVDNVELSNFKVGYNPDSIRASAVTLDTENATLAIDDTITLRGTVSPENALVKNISWSSSDEKIVKLVKSDNSTATFSALAAGTAEITATTADGALTAKSTITVSEPQVAYTNTTAILDEAAGTVSVYASTLNAPDGAVTVAGGYNGDDLAAAMKTDSDGIAKIKAPNLDKVRVFLWESLDSMRPLLPSIELPIMKKLPIVAATASQTPEALNVAENIFDGDRSTKWACNGSGNIVADLGDIVDIKGINLFLIDYIDNRTAAVSVSVSSDNKAWEEIGTTTFNNKYGYTRSIEINRSARYVRLSVNGTSQNSWITVSELEIYGE